MAAIRLRWNANTEPDLAGYKVYVGRTTGMYDVAGSPITVGQVTEYVYTFTPDNADWFFALTAHNQSGQQSPHSDEIVARFLETRPALRGT